jgi:uncharacterized protein YceK
LAILVTIAVLLVSGCGTVFNLASGEPTNYGGVQRDLKWMTTPRDTPMFQPGTQDYFPLFILACLPIELGLSFTADTLTLPLVMYLSHKDHPRDDRNAPASDSGTNLSLPRRPIQPGNDSAYQKN